MLSSVTRFGSVRLTYSAGRPRVAAGALITLFAAVLAGCDSSTSLAPREDAEPAGLQLSRSALTVDRGDTARITASVVDRRGVALSSPSAGAPVAASGITWTSSNPSIADISRSGLVVAQMEGEATITATNGVFSRSSTVTVQSQGKSITISPRVDTLTSVGHTSQLSVTVLNGSGKEQTNPSVSWATLDPSIASVDAKGLVTAVAAGAALITATAQGQVDSARVVVLSGSSSSPPVVASVVVDPKAVEAEPGEKKQFTATVNDGSGKTLTGTSVIWSSGNPDIATVDSKGVVTARKVGSASIRASVDGKSGSGVITVAEDDVGTPEPEPSPEPQSGDIVVAGFTSKAVQDALAKAAANKGGVVRFPAGTYDLRDWPTSGVRIDVPITLIGDGSAVLRGSANAQLFDLGKQAHVEGLEFRTWLRAIRFARVGEITNHTDAAYVRVVRSRFYDMATAIEGRSAQPEHNPSTAHRIGLVRITESHFERTRRAVDFRLLYIDRFEFTRNQVREVIHRNPEPDVPGNVTSALFLGTDRETPEQRATEVIVQHNDIRRVRNDDMVNGRAYAILAYRGPTIVENNHIEDVVSGGDSEDGSAAIYQRSHTYARFANNRVVNGASAPNVGAIMSKQWGAPFEVLNNEIVFTDAFKNLHNSPEYTAFEGTVSDLRFEGNTVRGATRIFVTRSQSGHYGLPKTQQIVRNNTFASCQPRSNTTSQRIFTLGYRRSLIEVSGNRFIDCSRSGNEFIFISEKDTFEETDELRITDNEWIHTVTGMVVPGQVVRFNAYPRRAVISNNRYEYKPSNADAAPTPPTFVMMPGGLAGESGARVTITGNQLHGLRNGTSTSTTVLDSRAGIAELVVERNRVSTGGHFVRLSGAAPQRTVVRDNDLRSIKGQSVRRDVQGGELIESGNIR